MRPNPFPGDFGCLGLLERHEAWALLAWASGHPRTYWAARTAAEWRDEAGRQPGLVALLRRSVEARAAGVPLAHLTGEREFFGMPFWITPDVLIPRQETEGLVALGLEACQQLAPLQAPVRLLEWGLGSGCLLVSLCAQLEQRGVVFEAWGIEQSARALAVGRANAARHLPEALRTGRIRLAQGSWAHGASSGLPHGWRADLALSNPPYLGAQDPHLLSVDLQHEPAEALVGLSPSQDGLADYRQLAAGVADWLEPGGWLLVEHGAEQQVALMNAWAAIGLADISGLVDDYGRDRFVRAQRPPTAS